MSRHWDELVEWMGEDALYSLYLMLAAYGKGHIDWEDLPQGMQGIITEEGWTREDCRRRGDVLEQDLIASGYIQEVEI